MGPVLALPGRRGRRHLPDPGVRELGQAGAGRGARGPRPRARGRGQARRGDALRAVEVDALRAVEVEALATRYRLRAVKNRWIPRLERALADVTLALEEQELADSARLRLSARSGRAGGPGGRAVEVTLGPKGLRAREQRP